MNRTYTFTFCFFFLISIISACSPSKQSLKSEPILYKTDFEVKHRIMHYTSDSSALQLIVESNHYELSYTAYSALNEKIVLTEDNLIIKSKEGKLAEVKFKVRENEYYLEVFIKDLKKNRVFRDAFKVDKERSIDHLQINQNGIPLVHPYVPLGSKINLYHPRKNTIWVKYFDKEFKAAAPPFSDKGFKFNPRKHFSQLVEVPNGKNISLDGEGLYFIQADTSLLDGIYINVFEDRYPRISSSYQMIESSRYITKSNEYNALSNSENQKEDIDNFWVSRAKDKDFAKQLIKTYYTRVQIANRDFTTYKEGWKTDRGMLYLIFGPPSNIKKVINGEIWSYASSGKRGSVKFQFKKKDGQTLLVRSDFFKRPWDVEVYEWRKGIINE